MKNKKCFRFITSLMLSVVMMMSLVFTANAASITITRDNSWDYYATENKATYTYYKIFDAEISADGNNAVYTISGTSAADKVAALPDIFTATLGADGKYAVTTTSTSASDIADALKTMVDANTALFPGTSVTTDDSPVVIGNLDNGYYLIEASNGSVLAVQTLDDVVIEEKNDYPTIDKQQKKDSGDYTDSKIAAEIGSYINYKVIVHIPSNANKAIVVADIMSDGLVYDGDTGLTVDPETTYSDVTETDEGYDADAAWQIKFSAETVAANKGSDIVITYRAQVTADTLTQNNRLNTAALTYDNGNYVLTDQVEYTTYYTGINKIDGEDNAAMEGVKFELTAGGNAVNVTKTEDGYYIPGGNSNVVVTDENGFIRIRGLDNTKTYILTETETQSGYNMLDEPVTLALREELISLFAGDSAFEEIENNKGTLLPSTGGIGTTIFYVIGGLLIICAGALLVTKIRMNSKEK